MKRPSSKVVDLNEFKAARAAGQLDLLDSDTGERPAPLESARALSDRDVAHRARMLAHLQVTSSSIH